MDLSQFVLFRFAGFIGTLAKFTPHAHALEGYYSVMAENATFTQILPQLGFLLIMGTVFFLIAVSGGSSLSEAFHAKLHTI